MKKKSLAFLLGSCFSLISISAIGAPSETIIQIGSNNNVSFEQSATSDVHNTIIQIGDNNALNAPGSSNIVQISSHNIAVELDVIGSSNTFNIIQDRVETGTAAIVQGDNNHASMNSNAFIAQIHSSDVFAKIEQYGNANDASIYQHDLISSVNTSSAGIQQSGTYNQALVHQNYSDSAVVSVAQNGNTNASYVIQYAADRGFASITQDGDSNYGYLEQGAANNRATIRQNGDINRAVSNQYGAGNDASIAQNGISNRANIEQTSDRSAARIDQYGSGNNASILQYGGSNNVAQISQVGAFMQATITQNGSLNTASIQQR